MWPFRTKRVPPPPGPPAGSRPSTAVYGHYRILQQEDGNPWLLGYGAMGLTYKAEDTNLRVPVALKVISPLIADQPGAREFFLAEARGAASLRHRNAASVHHLGVNRKGELFFAMEFVEGENVEAVLARQHRLPVPLALDFAQQTACALAAAGRRGLVHRDLKPANLMLSDEGDGTVIVKVIDFGLCKQLQIAPGAAAHSRPAENQFFGTPHYASPEQIRCDPNLDQRSDFYSLGATLWKMLSGHPVFDGPGAQVRQRHLEEAPAFDDLPGDVSPPVRRLLASLLHKEAAGRPPTSLELIDRIEGAAYDHRGAEADPRRHWKGQGCVPLLGSVLAHNYHLEAVADEDQSADDGPMFRAEDIAGQRFVAVQLLDPDKPSEALRASVERLTAAPHPNLVDNHAFSSCRGQAFVVREWINGFPLADLLRARHGKLLAGEVPSLLSQAALALEHAQAHQLGRVELRPAAIQLHFSGEPLDAGQRRTRLAEPMNAWPDFTVKFRVWVNELDGPSNAPMSSADDMVRRLADFAAELLGNAADAVAFPERGEEESPAPLAALPRAVESVLSEAASSGDAFGRPSEFVVALTAALQADAAKAG